MTENTEKKNPIRLLIGKVGLDGHTRGVYYVAHIFRDAGYEVIYPGLRQKPEQIVNTAIQEDVQAIGLSFLSGAHIPLTQEVLRLLKEKEAEDIPVFCGGVIPDDDIATLINMGIKLVFTPGTSDKTIIEKVTALLAGDSHEGA
ncbi:MAG: cobalamin B12-binding domain-containing protein [Candidatus Paceibacterota bacterium]|jgi:methylmalonyl-CoA mutase C-terminal domain/subunit